MSELVEIIDSLETKLQKLFERIEELEQNNQELQSMLEKTNNSLTKKTKELELTKEENKSLIHANSLLGSNDHARETKLKINSLIREIDYCIEQLKD